MSIYTKVSSPKTILTSTGGFLSGYTHSLNPYVGCAFSCSYCYVRRLPVALFRKQEWGTWVDLKAGAAELLRKEIRSLRRREQPIRIFMSSSTDPYQPVEYKEKITRSLLEVMIEEMPDFLFVQTRSPLVTRDMDLFLRLKDRIRISVTVETDLEDVRRIMAPASPPLAARLHALKQLTEAGLPTQVAVAPVLPSSDRFGSILAQVTNRVCIDDFFMGDGSNGRRTKQLQIEELYKQHDLDEWYDPNAYKKVYEQMKAYFSPDNIKISTEGFS
ncbi:radical SAM protein [Paenibacillus albiflavus]|uniref:Radical SAM protein n=1 Tax=Paenibacillus albiflavus TaxID=2545760 RepID=A0A4R4EQV1_9BACL|nr:radical SAM protein [Paenibacillus albiflavus]TCZ81001.1 radical SAM protein [Paenibacillus albiflavus]